MKIVVCLTTFNRTDCARILMEIIKLNWPQAWPIVHACSSPDYEPYLEDELVRREPLPLTAGALDLLTSSILTAMTNFDADYVVHLEADTWIFNQQVIEKYVQALAAQPDAVIAGSSWGTDKAEEWRVSDELGRRLRYRLAKIIRPLGSTYGLREMESISTQFFVAKANKEFADLLRHLNVRAGADMLEKALYQDVVARFGLKGILGMPEREPVHPHFRQSCEALSLVCHHWPSAFEAPSFEENRLITEIDRRRGKRECLANSELAHVGPHMKRLLEDEDLSYYNGTAKRSA
jgi:hypothetical protein